jgi:alkanesulfonate monooxygenase SsuD/methylene tetrahydromethanopterin reductase-like flavin-dependent oxidoreductase (luciferase family)
LRVQLVMICDLSRAPFGAPWSELYAAALDQCAWADAVGFDLIALGEHHGSPDGYDPSPVVAAAAIAARTGRIGIRLSVLLGPLYDPVKLAEDLAVASIFSRGRLIAGIGAGYRPSEYDMFGQRLDERWERLGELVGFLKQAWTGEPFGWRGRRVRVSPVPDPRPPIVLGGAYPRSARRAAHIADGWLPRTPELWEPYRRECIRLGRADPGPYPRQGPLFLHVSRDPERDWQRIEPHARYMVETYGRWQSEAPRQQRGAYAHASPDDVRASASYRVLMPEQALELAQGLGAEGVLYVTPLLSGLDPALAWESLRLLEREVLPHLPGPSRGAAPPAPGPGA